MSRFNTRTRLATGAIAIALAGSGFGGGIGEAFAQDANPVVAEVGKGPLASTFPADGTSSLTLHKRENPVQAKDANPKGDAEQGDIPGKAAGEGYTFTLTRVATGQQLKDQKVFNALAGISQVQSRNIATRINANEALQEAGISAPEQDAQPQFTLNTNAQGEASQDNIPNGAYLVKETVSPDGVTAKVHPFLVFLPQPDPAADTKQQAAPGDWNSQVHVYPKSGRTNINKTVVDSGKHVGNRVEYTLSATVPSSAQGEELAKFQLRDMFNKAELGNFQLGEANTTHLDGNIETVGASQGEVTDLGAPTQLGSNASVVYNIPTEKLKPGDIVTVKVSAQLLESRQDSEIINQARTIVRHSGDDADKESSPSNVRTYVGDVELTKYNDANKDGTRNDGEEALQDAKFEIFSSLEAAQQRANNPGGQTPETAVASATTGADGKARFTGLHATDFENNAAADLSYYMVEVEVPEGFVLPEAADNVREVKLTRADHNAAEQGQPVRLVNSNSEIPNVPNDRIIPELPVTGGGGAILMGLAALALLGGAGGYAALRNRRA